MSSTKADRDRSSPSRRPVVVTGAAGFVGGHLARALARAGSVVVATDLGPVLPEWVQRGLPDSSLVQYVPGDLVDDAQLDAVLGAGFEVAGEALDVVHVAALTRYHGEARPTPREFLHAFAVNAALPWRLGARLADSGRAGRLVHVSTRSVFGRREPTAEPIQEETPFSPNGTYGTSKAAGEVAVHAFRDELGLDAVVGRITGVFGAWQGPRSPVARILEAAVTGQALELEVPASRVFEVTYVKDTVRGLATLLHAEGPRHQLYHLSSGSLFSLAEVASAARSAAPGARIEFTGHEPPGAWRRTALAVDRAAEDLGYRARWPLVEAMADAVLAQRTGEYGPEALDTLPPASSSGSEEERAVSAERA